MNHSHSSRFTSFAFGSGDLSRTLSSPMAESTQLDSSGSRGNLLGSSPLRQMGTAVKRKPTSPLLGSKTNFKSSGNLTGSGFSRIDPQVYTDAQSRGLVNRLVKYHDKSQASLNRSQSMTNLYSKPGQFPVVHLKKTEIKYSPRRNNSITSVRIAPPEKSVFQANTRSNILRAGSLLIPAEPHLARQQPQAAEDEIDAENRVIAPTGEVEAAPTRSVLDALKEISRKRINNEELDADRIKKQCKELSEVDSGGVGTKRARELPSSASPPSQGLVDQQLQKKRLCNKNNDISSSLSSSLVMNTPRRVEPVPVRPGRLNVDQSFSQMMTPAAFNATVAVEPRFESREPVKLSRIESAPLPQITRIVPEVQQPQRAVRPQPTQPKITLFNKKYDETLVRLVEIEDEDQEQDDDDGEGGRINFIKPKDKSPIMNSDKVALKRVEKSKLSLILSCLSEDFDDEKESPQSMPSPPVFATKDTVDAKPKIVEKKDEVPVPKLSGISALINNPIMDPGLGKIEPPKAAVVSKPMDLPKSSGGFSFGTTTTTAAVTAPKPAETSFAFGTPTKPSASEAQPAGGFTLTTSAASSASLPKSDAPPAYSFPAATNSALNQTVTVSSAFTLTPAASPTVTATKASPSSLISFSPAPLSSKPASAAANEKPAFTILPPISTNASTGSAQTSATTTQSGISFGSGTGFSAFKPPSSSPGSAAPAIASSTASALPSFGTVAATTTNPSAGGGGFNFGAAAPNPATSTASAFSFGGGAAASAPVATKPPTAAVAPTPTAVTAAPVFGGFGNATTTAPSFAFGGAPPKTSAPPAFGSSTATPAHTFGSTAGSTPSFGGFRTSNSAVVATATTTAPFGSSTSTVSTGGASGMFGAIAPKSDSTTFGQVAANSTFSFGGAGGASAAPQSSTTQNSNAFSFGGAAAQNNSTQQNPPANIFGTAASKPGTGMQTFGAAATAGGGATSFGAVANSHNPPPAFGTAVSGNANNNNQPPPPAFGAPPNVTAPGGNGGFGASPVFGANSGASAMGSSVFGGSTNTASGASPFGTASSAPTGGMFGAALANNNNNNNNNQSTVSSGAFAFGGSSAPPNVQAPAANKPFAFGGAGNNNSHHQQTAPAATPIKSNSFSFSAGGNAVVPQTATPLGGSNSTFSFAAAGNNNNNGNNNAAAPPPAFGSNNSSFSFSNVNNNNNSNNQQQHQQNQATVKPFSFGGPTGNNQQVSQQAVQQTGGIFGGNNQPAVGAPPAFNFNAGSNPPGAFGFNSATPVAAQQQPTPGGPFAMPNGGGAPPGGAPMFSIGTSGMAPPGRRPIRTATRRLK